MLTAMFGLRLSSKLEYALIAVRGLILLVPMGMVGSAIMTEFKCSGYTDDGHIYELLTSGAVILTQAIEQFQEYVGHDFDNLSGVNFEMVEVH